VANLIINSYPKTNCTEFGSDFIVEQD